MSFHKSLRKIKFAAETIDRGQGRISGEIVGIDHFGNLLTNISGSSLHDLYAGEESRVHIMVKDRVVTGIQTAYTSREPGQILAIVGSRGFLEIAVNQGEAANLLGAVIGDEVIIAKGKR